MTAFDVKTADLNGLNLIEASAGTGKTYTLAELYLRLIIEHQLNVDQILVVTYTRAATEELRDRLRQKLVAARDDLDVNDPGQHKLFHRLNLAIQSFDEAAIYTIHGFCQRVLSDFAFESGQQFELELIGDDVELLQAATDDFWRRHIVAADAELTAYLLAKKQSPETLLQSIRALVGKPYLHIQPLATPDVEHAQRVLNEQFETVKKVWLQEQDEVIATLSNKALLKATSYSENIVERSLLHMIGFCEQERMPAQLFDDFLRFTPARLEKGLKKDQQLPELKFWTTCEDLMEKHQYLQQVRSIQLQQLRLDLLQYLQTAVPQQKLQQQVQSYDDLLINLDDALNGEQGEALVAELRQQFKAALIDEFQDTDPVQYASFSRIYADSGLPTFFVGDPKQAIYSFRGADIFTYLTAKAAAEKEHTLTKNWRSHPLLVSAVNRLFEQVEQAFLYEGIPFYAVDSARENEPVLQLAGQSAAPFELVWHGSDKALSKKEMTALAAEDTANQIAQLLNQAITGEATLWDEKQKQQRAICGGDIAVLVRNHRQASEIQQSLRQRGINSVQQGRDNVFASAEAMTLLRLMMSVSEPNNDYLLAALLTTPLFDLSAAALYQTRQDEQQWIDWVNVLHEMHHSWLQHGFMTMFRQLLNKNQVQQRVLQQADGERKMTNLLHLAELIQEFCSRESSHMEAAIHWFNRQRANAQTDQDAAQVRLESDEQLVKIITIHKSKGLEYPIVFCPFLWDVSLRSAQGDLLSYHDPDQQNQACVALTEPYLDKARAVVQLEEKAEDLRLLYVALTRPRERCVVFWGHAKGVEDSALYYLLHNKPTEMAADLDALVERYPDYFALRDYQSSVVVMLQDSSTQQAAWQARQFNGNLRNIWRISSFSALTAGHDAELPDYDAMPLMADSDVTEIATQKDRFAFPKGAQAGTCLHSIFEQWDFQDAPALEAIVSKQLTIYGFDNSWCEVVCDWLNEIVASPLLDDGFTLNQLPVSHRLDEMAFYFPAALDANQLKKALKPHLTSDAALTAVIERLSFRDLNGFMKGFIDLVFEHQGQFFVVDYKSNFLGYQAGDYQRTALDTAMISHDYPLQYLIYTLALHRYLSLRLPDYDPEQHLGGVAYLFIRGMKQEWPQSGVYFEPVNVPLLRALDDVIRGAENE